MVVQLVNSVLDGTEWLYNWQIIDLMALTGCVIGEYWIRWH
jgi:hypothetical protein